MQRKLDKYHFKVFSDSVDKWIGILGLKSYRIQKRFKKLRNANADMEADTSGRVALIRLSKTWIADKPTDIHLEQTAAHETFHLLLYRLEEMAKSRSFSESDVNAEVEAIVTALTGMVGELHSSRAW
ncbi:MAG: hypothetical protein KGL39_14240 [Patescibacteria group bacterium]|nr:hypothetical protein [Patescibacteria group bacterium]